MYWKLHTGMTDELYNSLRDLLDTLEEVYLEKKGDHEVHDMLKSALDFAVTTIREIGT